MKTIEKTWLQSRIIEALETCYDPEIPVDIYQLGLVYAVKVDDSGDVEIRMTLTTPNCPVATSLPDQVQSKISAIPGVRHANVEIVWDPPWGPSKMSDSAKLQLGML